MPLILQPNSRYEYTGKLTYTGPHKHDIPIGCEPAGSECDGCIYADDDSDITVVWKRDGTVKERAFVNAAGELKQGSRLVLGT